MKDDFSMLKIRILTWWTTLAEQAILDRSRSAALTSSSFLKGLVKAKSMTLWQSSSGSDSLK